MDGYDFQKLHIGIILRTQIRITQVIFVIKVNTHWISIIIWKEHNFVLSYQKKFERERERTSICRRRNNERGRRSREGRRSYRGCRVRGTGLSFSRSSSSSPTCRLMNWVWVPSSPFCFCGLLQLFSARCR